MNQETKYYFKRNSLLRLVAYAAALGAVGFFIVVWIGINLNFSETELPIVANIFLPVLIGLGIVGILVDIFLISRLYYVKLTPDAMIVSMAFGTFAKRFKYSELRKISLSGGMLRTIHTHTSFWPVLYNIDRKDEFIAELSSKFRESTRNELVIEDHS